jgi:hypothetical protein
MKQELLKRFVKTKETIITTFNYVELTDGHIQVEAWSNEEAFKEIVPCFLFMYAILVEHKLPQQYKDKSAQRDMAEKLLHISGIVSATYKKLTLKDDKCCCLYELLETFLLMYQLYGHGEPTHWRYS